MARAFFPGHNYQINLDEGQDGTEYYHQMFAFLRQSRIYHVLSHVPVLCEPYLIDFWTNARYIKRAGGEIIQTRVANQDLEFSANDLRVILLLGTEEQEGGARDLMVFDRSIISGGLRRMGFSGELTRSTLFKKGFFGRWRYLAHVLLVALSNKKSGWDTLNQETQAQMVGIVYNKPYSFSKFFFNEFRKQISARGTTRFLMYPRFVMMIINVRLPNLPVIEPVRRVTTLIRRSYNEFIARHANDPNAQDVELFGAVVNINFATPSDEDIANFDGIPAPQQLQHQKQPQPQPEPQLQPEVAASMVNVMLDEQAANPQVAQAVLQEKAPIDEAYHDVEMPEVAARDDAAVATSDVEDQAEKGKGILGEGDKAIDLGNSSDSDDDDDDETRQRPKIVRVGSKMVSVGGSATSRKRKEPVDPEYRPEEEAPVTSQSKRTRSTLDESAAADVIVTLGEARRMEELMIPGISELSTGRHVPLIPFQLNDMNNKLKIMEGTIRTLAAEMEDQKKQHDKELSDQSKRYDKDMNMMRLRIDRLTAELEKEKAKNTETIGNIVSDIAEEMVSHVSKSDLDVLIENFLMKKGLIPDLGCKGDELLKKRDDDQNDDPDAAEGGDQARYFSGDMSKALVVFKGDFFWIS